MCGQLLLHFDISLPVKLLFISSACGCDKVDQLHNLTTDLHLIIRMNDELRLSISIDKALTDLY